MRALCGAIIAAGSLIGLGLAGIGFGVRYQHFTPRPDGPAYIEFKALDTPLMLAFVVLLVSLVIGFGIAFAGLAYHHHRRESELMHLLRGANKDRPADRISV